MEFRAAFMQAAADQENIPLNLVNLWCEREPEFKVFAEKSGVEEWKMVVIAINKILDEVWAKYPPGAKVPLVVIAAEMQMFPINQVSTHIWNQAPKSILKGKGVDPLEHGGAMEAGGSKVKGKQGPDGEKGKKKKEKKEKKEKKTERLAKGSNGGQDSGAAGSELGWLIAGGDSGAGTNKETRG
ncbi:hypothetical protein PAXRUDRAFT_18676 [Paxillus rubicundulus Ve08.2h10]|uniref:Unplaced genomic scaffold scaffold_3034, whole genome shotgun sequence n=1 Tax=Paxillus rubicundulus Ve08.2h10 TaxID=930991 RepID=A0A0D0CKN8_9AGAM|nr:hypothetical protein PAXRUDRAFT_18676 [Paxillus rubicundulus Ve08.2h10]